MSATTLKLPQLSMGVREATVIEVLVKVGDRVELGDPLLVVETDKVEVEIPAAASGIVTEVLVSEEMDVESGQPLFKVEA